MKKIITLILVLIPLHFSFGAQKSIIIPSKIQQFIETIEAEKEQLQGGAIAILYKGQVIYKTTFGDQQGKSGKSITSKTLFPLASVSKSVAATALALMVEAGEVDLSEECSLFCLKSKVNLKHILSHTTGVDFPGNPQIERGISRPELLKKLKTQPVGCRAGGCYSYSNTTYSLIEDVLNKKGLKFRDAVEKLQAALKTDEIQILPLNSQKEVAYPHQKETVKRGKISKEILKSLPFPPYYPKTVPAAAGVFASLDGMIELLKLQSGYRSDLIHQTSLDQFYDPVIANQDLMKWRTRLPFSLDGVDSYYGLGFRVLVSKKNPDKKFIYHGGYIAGISTFFGFVPSEEFGIIILSNQSSRFPTQKGLEFGIEFLDNEITS